MKHIKLNLIAATLAALVTSASFAQAAGQTIIVDGVRYQAVGAAPVATPVQVAAPIYAPAPVAVQPVAYPAASAPVAVVQQQQYSAGQVIVPVVLTAMGVWAASQWFDRDWRVARHQRHAHGHGHVHGRPVPPPVVPVVVTPVHGGHGGHRY